MSEHQESQNRGTSQQRTSLIRQEKKGNTLTSKVASFTPQETSLSQTFARLGKNPPDDGFSKSREAMKDYNARNAVQRMEDSGMKKKEEEEKIQMKKGEGQTSEGSASSEAMPEAIKGKKENNTGLPDNLKSGIENLSGYSMDDVKVHYNSDKPAQLQAHAYAQGTDIHLGSGQEKHLPHEAWHVVQQKQGRVKPTMQMKGKVNINDDVGLEKEADVMGAKSVQMKPKENKSKAVGYDPSWIASTIIQKQDKEDVHYGSQNDNTWIEDKNEVTGKVITYDSEGEAQIRMEYLKPLGEWENFEVKELWESDKRKYYVAMQGRRTINNFILLIKKVEAAYPSFTTDEILDGFRALNPGYNTNRWRLMLGKSARAVAITPVDDKLTQKDIDALSAMIIHEGSNEQNETGILKDNGGDYLASGHVLTGITAGLNRETNTDLTSGFAESAGGFFGVGENLDNLYASTIGGDLGQSATIINNQDNVTSQTPMIGDGTEATHSELFGDIDGFNIGSDQTGNQNPLALSELLSNYYGGVEENEKENRFQHFNNNSPNLEDQTSRFATNFAYQVNGKGGGLVSRTAAEAGFAVDQFEAWVTEQMKTPSKPEEFDKKGARLKPVSGIWMVSDPSNYQEKSQRIQVEGGVTVKIIDRGLKESFNADVQDKQTYGWTEVMLVEGANEGTIGWVSNAFIDEK